MLNYKDFTAQKALALLPPIKRARGFYLYSLDGKRYSDFFLGNATALWGHTPQAYGVAIKNCLDQALYSALPNIWQKRLQTALEKKFHCHVSFRLKSGAQTEEELFYLRAHSKNYVGSNQLPAQLILPEPLQLYSIILSNEARSTDLIPAWLCRASLRILSRFDTLELNTSLSALFDRYPALWQQKDFYFYPAVKSPALYHELFTEALSLGILLPPTTESWGALTHEASFSIDKNLVNLFDAFSKKYAKELVP